MAAVRIGAFGAMNVLCKAIPREFRSSLRPSWLGSWGQPSWLTAASCHGTEQLQTRCMGTRSREDKQKEIEQRFAEWKMPERRDRRPLEERRVLEFKEVVHSWVPPCDLEFEVRPELVRALNASGWAPPAGLNGQVLPFHIFRTFKGEQLPVYTEFKAKKTRVFTIIRRVRGDLNSLAKEMSKVCDGRPIEIKSAALRVTGNYSQPLKYWLTSLGF